MIFRKSFPGRTSVRVDPELQRPRSDEGDKIALPLPGGGLGERDHQIVIQLRAVGRASTVLHWTWNKDHAVARHRELALAALAPELEDDLAIVADVKIGDPFRSGLTRRVER